MRKLLFLAALCFSFHAKAALIVWEFEVEITEYEDQLNMYPGLAVGDTFTGYFGYDDDLQQTNSSTYVNSFESDTLIFGLDFSSDANAIVWEEKYVSVVHQGGRDIVDFYMETSTPDFASELELGFLDYNKPYGQGELPLNWHDRTDGADTPEFYIYVEDKISGLIMEVEGEITNISLRQSTAVPAPAAIWLIAPLALLVLRRRHTRK